MGSGERRWNCALERTAALAVFLAGGAIASAGRAEEIRIEIVRGHSRARLESPRAIFREGPDGSPLEPGQGAAHTLRAEQGHLFLDDGEVRVPLVVWAVAGPLRVDARAVGGRIEVFADAGELDVVDALDLEDYVAAVVASEVPSSWPHAALEAQAVAARTYAVAQKIAQGPGARAHLGASVLDQVYAGSAAPQVPARAAAKATAGEVLTFGAAPIAAFFSSSCGGKGESAEAAFGLATGTTPYLPGGDDGDADAGAPRLRWAMRRSFASLTEALRKAGRVRAAVTGLEVEAASASGRVRRLRLRTEGGAVSIPGAELRQILGYGVLPSLLFTVEVERSGVLLRGRGSGHGVGLCQWGARGRALRGDGYQAILAHYYPGAEIRRMY